MLVSEMSSHRSRCWHTLLHRIASHRLAWHGMAIVPILYALDEVPGSAFGALHNSMQGWQAKARMHKFAVDGAKP